MDKHPSNPHRSSRRSSGSTGESRARAFGRGLLSQQSERMSALPAGSTIPRRRRDAAKNQANRVRSSGPPRLAKLLAYGLLLILTASVCLSAWDSVSARRAELHRDPNAAETPFQTAPILLSGTHDRWDDASLARSIDKAIVPGAGTTCVYVKSLNTGASAAIDEERVVPSASLFKVPILVELLRQQSLGMSDMNTTIKLQQKHWSDGAGVLQAQIGKEYPVHELVDLMIDVSDNIAALALLDLVGTDNVNLTLQANGLEATRLRIGQMNRNWGGTPGVNTTSAREIGTLLEKVATGKIMSERYSKEAIRLLSQQQQVTWLPSLLPPRDQDNPQERGTAWRSQRSRDHLRAQEPVRSDGAQHGSGRLQPGGSVHRPGGEDSLRLLRDGQNPVAYWYNMTVCCKRVRSPNTSAETRSWMGSISS
ncbi:MAG TPA: serine hydrolase [Chloroflexota bacterium]|nr:serine hydrolase [Chloroflexota bacterium]